MTDKSLHDLSRRERQIMEIVFMLGRATAAQILEHMPDGTSDGSLRKLVRILEGKGYLAHERQGREHVYSSILAQDEAQRQAADNMLKTLFRGSLSDAVSALLDTRQGRLTEEQAEQIRRLIDAAEKEGR